jgi:hypothetical protein
MEAKEETQNETYASDAVFVDVAHAHTFER